MQQNKEMFKFSYTGHGKGVVDSGVKQLWALPGQAQEEVINQAMECFNTNRPVTLALLGFSSLTAADLVRQDNEFYGSRLSDKDILTCLLLGNLDMYPLHALIALKSDGLDCGIWDGEFGETGYYYMQDGTAGVGVINPGDSECIEEMWTGPLKIPRVKEMRTRHRHLNMEGMEDEQGCMIMQPGVTYLCGIWPAVRIMDLNIRLETRSNFGRWAIAGAVNSVTVHNPYNGVLTAEATTFAHRQMILNSSWLPFQMGFEYVNPGLNRKAELTFSVEMDKSVDEAAREFQAHPEKMLPRQARVMKGNRG